MPPAEDLTGQQFGQLTALYRIPAPYPPKKGWWWCRCACGSLTKVIAYSLKSGATRSCGCLKDAQTSERFRTHGRSKTAEYRIWAHIVQRTQNPTAGNFTYYGGRGISMAAEWRESFQAFYRDVGPRPSPQHQIERLDNDGPYAPGNVEWKTKIDQANNMRSNHRVEWNGETKTLMQWSRSTGISYSAIKRRLRRGLPLRRVFGHGRQY